MNSLAAPEATWVARVLAKARATPWPGVKVGGALGSGNVYEESGAKTALSTDRRFGSTHGGKPRSVTWKLASLPGKVTLRNPSRRPHQFDQVAATTAVRVEPRVRSTETKLGLPSITAGSPFPSWRVNTTARWKRQGLGATAVNARCIVSSVYMDMSRLRSATTHSGAWATVSVPPSSPPRSAMTAATAMPATPSAAPPTTASFSRPGIEIAANVRANRDMGRW